MAPPPPPQFVEAAERGRWKRVLEILEEGCFVFFSLSLFLPTFSAQSIIPLSASTSFALTGVDVNVKHPVLAYTALHAAAGQVHAIVEPSAEKFGQVEIWACHHCHTRFHPTFIDSTRI